MRAKTSGNFWHIILRHGHCGGVGAQRIEIIIIMLIIIIMNSFINITIISFIITILLLALLVFRMIRFFAMLVERPARQRNICVSAFVR